MANPFSELLKKNFDIYFTYHADAILCKHFPEAISEINQAIGTIEIPIEELIRGGGGEAKVTQRLRRSLNSIGWEKRIFEVEKKINNRTTFSESHEVDHIKDFDNGTIALEIEWNNKDPFFDRDLENFNRLHSDGAISIGIIITRGESLQDGLRGLVENFAKENNLTNFEDLAHFDLQPTNRQKKDVENAMKSGNQSFQEAWALKFTNDKFGAATTHWVKLQDRLRRGVGSPCPLVGVGIPISCIKR